MMKQLVASVASMCLLTIAPRVGIAWAEGKVIITREENKPKDVEIKAGDSVRFINSSGQTAHVWFAGNDAIRFYVPGGGSGSTVQFGKPGTYEYTVHVTGGKIHSHVGSVVVK